MNEMRLHENPFGLAGINLAGVSSGEIIAQVKYTPYELCKTVTEFIKDKICIDVEAFMDFDDVIEYELYFIRLEELDEVNTELLEKYFETGVDLYHEMTRSIIDKMFKGYVKSDYVEAKMGKIDGKSLITFEFSYEGYRELLGEYSEERVIQALQSC